MLVKLFVQIGNKLLVFLPKADRISISVVISTSEIIYRLLTGTIPAAAANFVANSQPLNIVNIRNALDDGTKKKGGKPDLAMQLLSSSISNSSSDGSDMHPYFEGLTRIALYHGDKCGLPILANATSAIESQTSGREAAESNGLRITSSSRPQQEQQDQQLQAQQTPKDNSGKDIASVNTPTGSDNNNDTPGRMDGEKTSPSSGGNFGPEHPFNSTETWRGIPTRLKGKVESGVINLIEAVTSDRDWETLFNKNGVIGRRKAGTVITVRGDGEVNHPPAAVFSLILDDTKADVVNTQLENTKTLERYNNHTSMTHTLYKKVWPTAARDMVTLSHWRMLPDGRIAIISFSEVPENSTCPEVSGVVRAELLIGGYLISPISGGRSLIQYLVQSDLKGTVVYIKKSFVCKVMNTLT